MSHYFFVRHGQASYGAADYDLLSPLGHEQCAKLGRWFLGEEIVFDRVLCGPARRHRESLAAIAEEYEAAGVSLPKTEHEDDLGEFPAFKLYRRTFPVDLHEMEDPHGQEAMDNFVSMCTRWLHGELDVGPLESAESFESRITELIARATTTSTPGENVLVITSGGVVTMAIKAALQLPALRAFDLMMSIENASVCQLDFRHERMCLRSFNQTAFLKHEERTFR